MKSSITGLELIDSGHILGSSAVKFEMDGDTVLYTGDASTRNRAYMDGFKPPEADILVMETTYGIPSYRFPPQEEVEANIREWIESNQDSPLILFGYSLGKAQKIQHIVEKFTDRPLIAHGSVKKMNDVVEQVSDLNFSARPYKENKEVLEDNGILIAPSNTSQADWVEKVVDEYGARKAGFSGWAVSDSFKYRGGYDETFVLSDHCDFDELVEVVEKVDPERVYTLHGFDEAFASHLKKELGINARALKKNQSSLTDF
ncbi:MAG: MBL fold metallo-hydrolase RNA specificity domain-containing protein [Candidatus Nanohalobium sp.]